MNEQQMLSLMEALDKGTNMFGALKPEVRSRLFAVVENPTSDTWDDAHGIMINNDRFLTLWQACLRYAGYRVTSKPSDGPWSEVPTREQILTALTEGCAPIG